ARPSRLVGRRGGVSGAGLPDSWKGLFDNTLIQVKDGTIPMARLDDAVRRILRVKVKAGLFENKRPLEGKLELLGAPEHRAVAREAVRKSLVLLKNQGVLPIKSSARVLVTGDGADDIGKQAGGWTLTWQGTGNKNSDFPNGQSIYAGIAEAVKAGGGQAELAKDGAFKDKPDVAVVVFGENPYAEFQGDITSLEYQPGDKSDLALIKKLKAQGIPVVAVFLSGRPLWTNPEINAADAFVAAWLPGSEGGGVADVLVGDKAGKPRHDFKGTLSFSWPKYANQVPLNHGDANYDPQFAYGYGLSYAEPAQVAQLSEDPGMVSAAVNVDRYFVAGRAPAPWTLNVGGALSVKPIDAGAQENARLAEWSGEGAGSLNVIGQPVDLSRQTTGDMAVAIRYRVDAAPQKPVTLAIGCGESCGAEVDVTSTFSSAKIGEWRTAKIKLSCFMAKGANMEHVSSPFALSTTGRFALAFTDIRLASNEGDAVCP
ncbi:MAG TPA: putative glycoside hydrolase, partial [Caulobacter sp.]|nr:putative glycoside hydrolase [Caulobacter sp.]